MQMQTSFTGKKMSGTKNLFQRLFVTPWKQHEPSSDSSIPGVYRHGDANPCRRTVWWRTTYCELCFVDWAVGWYGNRVVMVRTRGGDRSSGSGHGRPDCDFLRYLEDRVINTPVEAKTYPCITNKTLCMQKGPIMCEVGWAQLARLHGGHGLELEEVLTNGANTQSVLPAEFAWPHRAIDELRLILVGKRVEPRNYFYTFCKLKPRSWSSKSTGIQEGSTSTPINIVGADES
ncbi:hypothetical protein Gotri_020817, partial [Gossypium trilobum]|nr:hypothetical protein [Gossypium trilobum]